MDLLAIVSSFAVVMLHTSGNATYLGVMVNRFTADGTWSVLTNILFAFAVPVFFMQSGAKVLNYRDRYDTKSFFTKRVSRVTVPFVFWSVLALFTWMKEKESKIRAWSFKDRLPLLAGITFGIYLLHPFVIYYFLPVMQKYLGASPVYIRYFAYPLAIYLISAALTVLLRKILGVKYVLT